MFGCLGHVHIPDVKRKKLDEKSVRCVFLGVSGESKAFRMYDPEAKKIIVSWDVVFEDKEKWDWNKPKQGTRCDVIEWGDIEKKKEASTEVETNDKNGVGEEDKEARANEEEETDDEEEASTIGIPVQGRRRRREPVWMRSYVTGEELSEEEDGVNQLTLEMRQFSCLHPMIQ